MLVQSRVVQSEPAHRTRMNIFDKHVHLIGHAKRQIDSFGLLQIEGNSIFTSFEPQKKPATPSANVGP